MSSPVESLFETIKLFLIFIMGFVFGVLFQQFLIPLLAK